MAKRFFFHGYVGKTGAVGEVGDTCTQRRLDEGLKSEKPSTFPTPTRSATGTKGTQGPEGAVVQSVEGDTTPFTERDASPFVALQERITWTGTPGTPNAADEVDCATIVPAAFLMVA